MTPITKFLDELSELEAKSGGDCKCHSMVTCPDKAFDYWGYFDEYVPKLIEAMRVLVEVVERSSHPHTEQLCKERCKQALEKVGEILKN